MADPISGELVIVPDAEALGTITGNTYDWWAAIAFAESYTDGVNSDYRLITRAEAEAILGNAELVSQLGLPDLTDYWTIEATSEDPSAAYYSTPTGVILSNNVTEGIYYALPIRKVNFYGLPLIESEFGGGLVYDVVASTKTVHVVAKWEDVNAKGAEEWMTSRDNMLDEIIQTYEDWQLPTPAQALKIFGNSYLVTLAGLPVDTQYWTIDEYDIDQAYALDPGDNVTVFPKTNLNYALPVRSEVVPET